MDNASLPFQEASRLRDSIHSNEEREEGSHEVAAANAIPKWKINEISESRKESIENELVPIQCRNFLEFNCN